VQAGADFLAVCSAVWKAADGEASAVKAFAAILSDGK
jgi:thiamine monophosphate synthase